MPTITQHTLDCGLPVVIEQSASVRSCSMTWMLPCGSAHDPELLQGRSTVISELLLRGSESLDSKQQADAFDSMGVARGTTTGTQYMHLSATMLGDKLAHALPLIVDMVLRPAFPEDSIEPSRELALQSLAGLADNPSERAGVILSERHGLIPLNRSGLGTELGLQALTREDLYEGWITHAKPVGSILAIAGAVDAGVVVKQLNTLLHAWKGHGHTITPTPSPTRGTYHHEQDESNQTHIYLAHEAPAEDHTDSFAERLVNSVLSGGSSSRLFTEVREKRALCYSVSAGYSPEKREGRVIGYVGTTPDKAQQSLDVMLEELEKCAGKSGKALSLVTDNEFRRAITGAKSRLVFAGESMAARASSLANDMHKLGRPRSLDDLAASFSALTPDGVNDYIKRRAMGKVTIVTLG
ncbi:MAG: M16 family metallopeptidase, partial [Phycisphaerales bacterium]